MNIIQKRKGKETPLKSLYYGIRMNDNKLKLVLFYGLTGIMFAILILLVFYNDYNYGIATLAIYTLIIILITSAVWISIFYWYILKRIN